MCVIAAKYLDGRGWVLAKNRDQNYVATLKFIDKLDTKVGEIFVLDDQKIDYKEGMNYKGLVIITTSLTPIISLETNKIDGKNIYEALHMSDPMDAAKFLVSKKLTGFIFCATPEKLVLVEAARKDKNGKQGVGDYVSSIRVIPKDEIVVRTNHGIDFPWAGFQLGQDKMQDMWYHSSIRRKEIAEKFIETCKTPEAMLDSLAKRVDDDLQMNVFRVEKNSSDMRTIFQWALAPKESLVYLRPIETKMDLKVSHEMISIKVLDNKKIKEIYDGRIKNFTKIRISSDKTHIKSEGLIRSFKNFLR